MDKDFIKKIEKDYKFIAICDVEIKLLNAKSEGLIIPDEVFTIIRELKESYK